MSKTRYIKYVGLATIWVLAVFTVFPLKGNHSVLAPGKKTKQQSATLAAETSNSKYSLTVNKSTVSPVDETTQTKRITLGITLNNNSSGSILVSPGLQMYILDKSGTLYPFTAKYLPANEVIGGPLDGGLSKSYDIDFDLPASVTPFALHFEPGGDYQLTELKL